jgi:hypothetical protein
VANGSWIVIIMDASPVPLQSTTVQQPPIDPQTPDLSSQAGWALNLPRSISGTVPYGGMSDGQMVMGSAMGGGGAQFGGGGFGGFGDFGGGSFGQPQPDRLDFGSQPAGGDFGGAGFGQPQQFGSQDFGGGVVGQPASVGFGAAPLTRENQAVVPPPLPPAGLSIPSFFVLDAY